MGSMRVEDVIAYRERWRAVEAVEREERRRATPEMRWRQLNTLVAMAQGLGLVASNANEAGVHARWATLRRRMVNPPGLDRARVERWVRQFADVLEMPELWEDVGRLL